MLLQVTNIETAYFDRLIALSGATIEVDAGRIVALLGPNGAGKTTLLRTVAGLLKDQPRKGTIELMGERIERRPPEAVARRGVVYVPEDRGLFRELTVGENLEVATWGRPRDEVREDMAFVHGLFPVLRERRRQQAETLSGGQQQMLALGRALLRRPRLLLLDEPSLGLAPPIARAVFEALRTIAARGTAILLVEQNAALALSVAESATILEAGRVVLRGTAEELASHEDVRKAYLGAGATGAAPLEGWRPPPQAEAVVNGTLSSAQLVESTLDELRFAKPRTWALLAAPLVLLAALPWAAPASWTVRATMVWIYAIGVLGQSLLIGHTGQVSFGQAGFLAIGAYAFAHLRAAGVPALPAILAGGLVAALFGVLLGLPALRLKGPYLAIATLGFGVAVYQALSSFEWLSGGRNGLDVPRLEPMLGLPRGTTVYYFTLALLLAFMAATWNLLSSYVGRAFAAIRDSDVAAEASGISLTRYKLLAFALSSFYTGVHGALFAQFLGHVEPQSFTVAESMTLFVAVIVGGLVFVEGAVLGAAFVVLLPMLFNQSGWLVPVVFGLSLIAVMLFEPLGLAGRWSKVRLYFETWPFR